MSVVAMTETPATSTTTRPLRTPRAILREYLWTTCRATLDPIPGETVPPLCLPRPASLVTFTESDVYTAGPGVDDLRDRRHLIPSHDPVTGEPDALFSRSPDSALSYSDTTGAQVLRLDRMRVLTAKDPARLLAVTLAIECGTVLDVIAAMSPEDRQTLGEIVQRIPTRKLARRQNVSAAGMHRQRSRALDRLLTLLYARHTPRG